MDRRGVRFVWAPEVEHRDVLWRRMRHVVLSVALGGRRRGSEAVGNREVYIARCAGEGAQAVVARNEIVLVEHIGIKDRASAGIVSLVSWFILMPQVTEFSPEEGVEPFLVDSIPLAWTGAKGVFIAMIVGFFAVGVFGYIIKKDWTIKMPEGVPPTVARAFSALIPMTVAFTAVWLVGIVFIISPWGNAFSFIYAILQAPLTSLGGTVWALAFSYVLASGFWFIGIHGSSVTGSIYTPILTALSLENQAAFAAGAALPNIVNREFETFFATFGGVLSTTLSVCSNTSYT